MHCIAHCAAAAAGRQAGKNRWTVTNLINDKPSLTADDCDSFAVHYAVKIHMYLKIHKYALETRTLEHRLLLIERELKYILRLAIGLSVSMRYGFFNNHSLCKLRSALITCNEPLLLWNVVASAMP